MFRHYPITCHFRKIHTLGSTEPTGIVEGELFGSVTVKLFNQIMFEQIVILYNAFYGSIWFLQCLNFNLLFGNKYPSQIDAL